MVEQSRLPAILLTRPKAQSLRFARQLRAAVGQPIRITIAPLMQLTFLVPPPLQTASKGLIFTSEAGVAAYLRLPTRPAAPTFCVGSQTAKSAEKAGLETVFVAKDAAELIAGIIALAPPAPLLHLRGEDSHGNVAPTLTAAGIPTDEQVVYGQRALPLAPHAARLLQNSTVILPLFSTRSARLFFAAAPTSRYLRVAALSPAVAAAIPPAAVKHIAFATQPDAAAMVETILSLLREPASA